MTMRRHCDGPDCTRIEDYTEIWLYSAWETKWNAKNEEPAISNDFCGWECWIAYGQRQIERDREDGEG